MGNGMLLPEPEDKMDTGEGPGHTGKLAFYNFIYFSFR